MTDSSNWPAPNPDFEPTFEEPIATFSQRAGGAIADDLLFVGVLWASMVGASLFAQLDETLGVFAFFAGFGGACFLKCKWEGEGGSPWRRSLGFLIVDDSTGLPIGTRRGFYRSLARILSQSIFYLGYLWMLWDPEKKTWHDKLTNTKVVVRR